MIAVGGSARELVQVTRDGANGSFTNPLWETIREEHGGAHGVAFAYGPRGFDLATGGGGAGCGATG